MTDDLASKQPAAKPRNVLNIEDCKKVLNFVTRGRKDHTKAWFRTIYIRWLLYKSPYAKAVMLRRDFHSPMARLLRMALKATSTEASDNFEKLVESDLHLIDLEGQPDWVQAALDRADDLVFIDVSQVDQDKLIHIADYIEGELPDREVRHTVEVMLDHVLRWDMKLAKQKMLGSLEDGVALIDHPVFETTPFILVRLVTEQAFKNEGATMKHCVGNGSYFRKKHTIIYSLRAGDSPIPLATIEVNTKEKRILQQQAFKDTRPSQEALDAIKAWADAEGLSTSRVYDDDEDEYDEEDDEGEYADRDDDEDEDDALPEDEDEGDDEEDDE